MSLKLPRLRQTDPVFMMKAWDELAKAIEQAFASLAANDVAIEAALEAAGIALAAAENANNAAEGTSTATSLANSSVTGLTLSASDAGASATITISAHTRIYGDGTTAAVSGGAITGLAYSTSYWIFYDAPKGTTGAVTYETATTVQGNATGDPGRHFVGAVTTPAALGTDIDGFPVLPPGGVLP